MGKAQNKKSGFATCPTDNMADIYPKPLSYSSLCHDKNIRKQLKEGELVLLHSSEAQSIIVGYIGWQDFGSADLTVCESGSRKK